MPNLPPLRDLCAELVEYIRVGAQLIFMELHERAPARVH